MSVLGRGDLAPSRNRGRRWTGLLVGLLAVLVLTAVAGGGYYLLASPGGGDDGGKPCVPSTSKGGAARPLTPAAVHLRVLNGTGRTGLAKSTASQLHARGFPIDGVDNTSPVTGSPLVRYGAGGRPAAELVALNLAQAVLTADPKVGGRVDLVLGANFSRLRTPAEVAAAVKVRNAKASVAPSPTCR